MEPRESNNNLEIENQILSIAHSIIQRYEANFIRHEIEKINYEDDDTYCLDIYVSGVSIESLIKMNIDLASEIIAIFNTPVRYKEKTFLLCNKHSTEEQKNVTPMFILCEEELQKSQEHAHQK